MKFCTPRVGNPGNVLLTRRNPPKYLFISVNKTKTWILFLQIDENDGIADGILNVDNLQCALQVMEYSLPQHKIRVLVEDLENKDKLVNGGVDKNLFIEVRTLVVFCERLGPSLTVFHIGETLNSSGIEGAPIPAKELSAQPITWEFSQIQTAKK